MLDVCHNYLEEQEDGVFLHRKGAVSAVNGPVILPGSRGTRSYLVLPAADTALSARFPVPRGGAQMGPLPLQGPDSG